MENEINIFDIYNADGTFIDILKFSLYNYSVKSWEDQSQGVSIYYGSKREVEIEENLINVASQITKEKFFSEYYIDSCVILLFRNTAILLKVINKLSFDEILLKQLLTILFSHPFFDYNARVLFVKNLPDEVVLPEGFWIPKIKRFKMIN